ncbi:JAB domain-containing protein [Paraclostridium sordellii]|uniref:JAB domain-containing protein n=1 Tax=Paraclostridium sordellii TaxID=1505 RepID=UPI001FA941F5
MCFAVKGQQVSIEVVSVGTINIGIVYPREVFKVAILTNTSKIICFHNHTFGNPNFSKKDEDIRKRVQKCGEILVIKLIDRIVVGDYDKYFSFKENFRIQES